MRGGGSTKETSASRNAGVRRSYMKPGAREKFAFKFAISRWGQERTAYSQKLICVGGWGELLRSPRGD